MLNPSQYCRAEQNILYGLIQPIGLIKGSEHSGNAGFNITPSRTQKDKPKMLPEWSFAYCVPLQSPSHPQRTNEVKPPCLKLRYPLSHRIHNIHGWGYPEPLPTLITSQTQGYKFESVGQSSPTAHFTGKEHRQPRCFRYFRGSSCELPGLDKV